MVKKLMHTRYRVTDMDQSVRFYEDVLGLKIVQRVISGRGSELVYFAIPGGDEQLELCKFDESGPVIVGPDLTHLGFEVDDIATLAENAKAHGYPLSDGPHLADDGYTFAFIDAPDGYEIELLQPPK